MKKIITSSVATESDADGGIKFRECQELKRIPGLLRGMGIKNYRRESGPLTSVTGLK